MCCAVAVLPLFLTACGPDPSAGVRGPDAAATAGWSRLPKGPLLARHSALAVAVGGELLLIGGRDTALCPPTASCLPPATPALTDAAAYDPGSKRWRTLAPIPVPVSSDDTQAAVLGRAVHVLVTQGKDAGVHLRYELSDNSWARLPAPPDHDLHLSAAGSLLVGYQPTQEGGRPLTDLLYRPLARRWEALPRDPLAPSFDRALTWTGEQLVLTGPKVTANPNGADGPAFVRAATLDVATRSWTRLPDQSEVISYGTDRAWDGEHVVSPYLHRLDGGETHSFGKELDTGGFLDLHTGRWARLPAAPQAGDGRYTARSGRWITADNGLVLDLLRRKWLPLPDHDAGVTQGANAAWVGDALVVWGGGDADEDDRGTPRLVATGSVWSPPS